MKKINDLVIKKGQYHLIKKLKNLKLKYVLYNDII